MKYRLESFSKLQWNQLVLYQMASYSMWKDLQLDNVYGRTFNFLSQKQFTRLSVFCILKTPSWILNNYTTWSWTAPNRSLHVTDTLSLLYWGRSAEHTDHGVVRYAILVQRPVDYFQPGRSRADGGRSEAVPGPSKTAPKRLWSQPSRRLSGTVAGVSLWPAHERDVLALHRPSSIALPVHGLKKQPTVQYRD